MLRILATGYLLLALLLLHGVSFATPRHGGFVGDGHISESEFFPVATIHSTCELETSSVLSDSIDLTVLGEDGQFLLRWVAPPRFSCLTYKVERAWSQEYVITPDARWIEVGDVAGICNVDQSIPYSYRDGSAGTLRDGSIQYRLFVKTLTGEEFHVYSEMLLISAPQVVEIVGLFPQPAARTLSVSALLPSASTATVRMYNSLGRMVYASERKIVSPGLHVVPVDVASLPSAFYLLELATADASATRLVRVLR